MELKTYLTILARRWRIVVLVAVVCICVSVYGGNYVKYEAETRLQVVTPMGGSMGDTYHETTFANRLMNTYAQVATSDQIKKELKEKLGLEVLPDISVKIIPDSEIIQILVESRDPALAARTANTLAELIITRLDRMIADSVNSEGIKLLNSRKAEVEKSLAQSQENYDNLVQSYSETTAKIAVMDRTLRMKEDYYQNLLDQYQNSLRVGTGTQSSALSEEISRLEKELESLNQQYEELTANSNKYSQQILMARQLIQNDQSVYANLISRYESVLSSQMIKAQTQNILIVSPAVEASEPILSRFFVIVLGALFGVIGGIVMAFVFDNLDTRIFTSGQVSDITNVPVLGGFPHFRTRRIHHGDIPPLLYGDYLVFRKKILNVLQGKHLKNILVSSPNHQEGKSTVVTGLANILAENGFKVLIIDANLRRPQQQIIYSISEGKDLITFLKNEGGAIEEAIRKNVKPGIDLLPCLSIVDDPAELLQVHQLKSLFEKVKMYDYVLIDTPAVLFAPDAYNLTTYADGIIVVVERGRTTSDDIRSTCVYLEDVNKKMLGIVFNQTPVKRNVKSPIWGMGWLNTIKMSASKLMPKHS